MLLRLLLGVVGFVVAGQASAASLDWSGTYRAEWMQIDRPSLGEPYERKAYGLHSLILNPRIIASDGVTIVGSFDVLASQDFAYADSQAGQVWGQPRVVSPNPDNAAETDSSRSRVLADTKSSTGLRVRQLYLNVDQEYGSLVVGRAPYEFGLGMVDHAGRGAFDHWGTSSDVVGYKFIVGNMFFMPMIGRVASANLGQAEVIQDERFQIQYESEDTGSLIGVMLNRRRGPQAINDVPVAAHGGSAVSGDFNMSTTSVVLGRSWEAFKFRFEAAFLTGAYGLRSAAGENILNDSYGFALEMDFGRPESKWDWALRAGVASGDDPSTADIESFHFHRNYDVAMLMFNHRLGGRDFLQTSRIRDTTLHSLSNSIDDETVSNVTYLAPSVKYEWNDRWDIKNTLVLAQLMANPTNSLDFKKDLGLELDIELIYKPRTNVQWVNQLGLLFPGGAFKDGASDLPNGFTYGFATKAAITF